MCQLSLIKLKNMFAYSQMTVINESLHQKKYKFLIYVEWLELICRIAIFTTAGNEPPEKKVFNLLKLMFASFEVEGKKPPPKF